MWCGFSIAEVEVHRSQIEWCAIYGYDRRKKVTVVKRLLEALLLQPRVGVIAVVMRMSYGRIASVCRVPLRCRKPG